MINTDAIGIHFEFSKNYVDHFARLLKNISIEKYNWYVSCSENYRSHMGNIDPFLPNGIYSGREFASIIDSAKESYIHLICLYAVPEEDEFDPGKVRNYEDYVKSSAVIALLSADSSVDFYTKDYDILKTVFESCERYYNNDNSPLYIITPQNDGRTGFWV